MTVPRITPEVREAAQFISYGHRHIPLDHPAMTAAQRTLRGAGVWSPADVISAQPVTPHIQVDIVGVFSAGGRRRTVHMILADGVEIGTALHWSGKTLYPWGLSLPAGNIVNFGFHSREDLVGAVKRFVRTGEIAR